MTIIAPENSKASGLTFGLGYSTLYGADKVIDVYTPFEGVTEYVPLGTIQIGWGVPEVRYWEWLQAWTAPVPARLARYRAIAAEHPLGQRAGDPADLVAAVDASEESIREAESLAR